MPRIAAALSIFAAAAFSIGFNIVRYPIVWEKLVARASLSQSADSAQPASIQSEGWDSTGADTGNRDAADKETAKPKRVVASISAGASSRSSPSPSRNLWSTPGDDQEASSDGGGDDFGYEGDDGAAESWDSGSSYSYDSSYSYGERDEDNENNMGKKYAGANKQEEPADRPDYSAHPAAKRGKKPQSRHDAGQKLGRPKEADDQREAEGGGREAEWTRDSQLPAPHSEDLVPVDRPDKSALAAVGSGSKAGNRRHSADGRTDARRTVRPLPSIDLWEEGPRAYDSPQSASPVAEYPSTDDS